ncbi:MAG TPA: MarR family transcriptional regulator [Trebonia sp.]
MPSGDMPAAAPPRRRLPGDVPLSRICGHLLRRSQQVHNLLWVQEFANDLTSPQFGVLAVLAARPGVDQAQLGELVSLDKSSVADVVARLAGRMWVSRQRDPGDARRNVLALTPAAAVAFRYLAPTSQRVQERVLAPVPAGDRDRFLQGLRVVARFEAPPGRSRGAGAASDNDVPGHLIRRAQRVHTACWAEVFDRELTGPQYAALYVLARWPDINQRQLGDAAGLDKSTAADILDRLERRGWVVRSRDPADGRGKLLALSDGAAGLAGDLALRVAQVQDALLAPLAPAVREEFLRVLALVAYAGEPPPALG